MCGAGLCRDASVISLFTQAGARLAITYNGITLNNPTDPDDDWIEVYDCTSQTSYEAVTDPNQNRDGMEVYDARKIARTILVRGAIRVPATRLARLTDRFELLAVAFDPALASLNNPTVNGFLAFDFSVLTEDTATNYPDGIIPSRYYARALKPPDPMDARDGGTARAFELTMLCRDPRRYLQSTVTLAGAGTFANTKADYISWPTITITMSGAGSATYQLANSTVGRTLRLDLSGRANLDVVVVDMEQQKVTINGTENEGIVNATSQWWYMKPGNNTITITNGTAATTSTVARPAFVI
jgi:hypothetical protein